MKARHKRFIFVGGGLIAVIAAAGLILSALNSNINLFFSPTQIANNEAPQGKSFRLGGMVKKESLKQEKNLLKKVLHLIKRLAIKLLKQIAKKEQ